MKNPLLLFIPLFFLKAFTHAQTSQIKFGSVSMADLATKSYSIDSTADAIVLFERSESYFGYDDRIGIFIESIVHVRKRILKSSAFSQGVVNLRYYQSGGMDNSENISAVKAATYNLKNGGIVKNEVVNKDIFTEKITDKVYQKKINFQNLIEGSLIEYTYTRRTPFGLKDKPSTWTFQGENPTLHSECVVTIPSHFYYQIIFGGYLPLAENTQEKVGVSMGRTELDGVGLKYKFVVVNAPAFKDEPYISSDKDFLSKVEFELSEVSLPNQNTRIYTTSWADLNRTLLNSDNFGGRISKTNYLKEVVKNFKNENDQEVLLNKVYNFMLNRFEVDGSNYNVFVSDLKPIFENKKGNANQINMIFIALLTELGFDVKPVILSTRDNGKINQQYALLDRFNYTIAQVVLGEKKYLIDLSDKFMPIGMIPSKCLNGTARVISKDGGSFIELTATEKYKKYVESNLNIDPDKNLIYGSISNSGGGYFSHELNKNYILKGEAENKSQILKNWESYELSKFNFENFNSPGKFPKISFDFKIEDSGVNSDMIYFTPLLEERYDQNPFKALTREYPIDLNYPQEITHRTVINVPKDFEIESVPKMTNIGLNDKTIVFNFSCGFNQETNQITVISRISLKNTIYFAPQYLEIKELFNKIVEKHAEQIVLKRK
jgi:hypothetical protein